MRDRSSERCVTVHRGSRRYRHIAAAGAVGRQLRYIVNGSRADCDRNRIRTFAQFGLDFADKPVLRIKARIGENQRIQVTSDVTEPSQYRVAGDSEGLWIRDYQCWMSGKKTREDG